MITVGITEKFSGSLGSGKPILASNSNALAKWLNLMLVATSTSHPERFRNGALAVDPFVASLTVFDYFSLGQANEELTTKTSNAKEQFASRSTPIAHAWSGLRGILDQAYSTKAIKGILGKSGLPISSIKYTGTFKGPVLDEVDNLVSSLNHNAREQFVSSCIQEILAFERIKAANLSKQEVELDGRIIEDLRIVLARFGHDLEAFETRKP